MTEFCAALRKIPRKSLVHGDERPLRYNSTSFPCAESFLRMKKNFVSGDGGRNLVDERKERPLSPPFHVCWCLSPINQVSKQDTRLRNMKKPCLMSAFPGKGKLDTVKPYAGRQYQNQSPPCGRKLCVRMGPQSAIHPHEKERAGGEAGSRLPPHRPGLRWGGHRSHLKPY